MSSIDQREASSSATPVAKVTRLVAHLARSSTEALSGLLGPSTMGLLGKLGADVTSQMALAYFVASVQGERGALRSKDVRALLLSQLEKAEAAELCALLQLPVFAPLRTLSSIDFEGSPHYLEHLDRWYGVETAEVEAAADPIEGSHKALASHKLHLHQLNAFRELRRTVGRPPVSVLVHMPYGSGKLRLVATAALDLYRSEADERTVVWFAPGAAMCEEAFIELQEVWRQIGSRDTTIFQLYGSHPTRDLDQLQGSIAVIDINRLSIRDEEPDRLERSWATRPALAALGATTSVAILGDAENGIHPIGSEIIDRMAAGGQFSLVGILSTPAAAITGGPIRASLKRAFPGPCITLASADDLNTLRKLGDYAVISGEVVDLTGATRLDDAMKSPGLEPDDSLLEFDPSYAESLAGSIERNESLLSILEQEAKGLGQIVFYATTAEQARLFAGLLPVHGIKARAVTAEESLASRSLALQRFVARDEKVLCVHGFLLIGSSIPEISVCLIAVPTRSRSAMIATIGRLVQARKPTLPPLKLIVAADSQADTSWIETLSTWSTLDSEDTK
ncbi:hypothetical protein [Acidovorax sp. ST3]|uniref:hypothetical protein n=1 Tax=Acidovorax sp. ST3 TaxID=2219062 RepID=UPI00128FDBE9|nr:hypothetical protein [Acidovorax sp. ST3]